MLLVVGLVVFVVPCIHGMPCLKVGLRGFAGKILDVFYVLVDVLVFYMGLPLKTQPVTSEFSVTTDMSNASFN